MIRVKDTFINKNDIRVIRLDASDMENQYLVIEYAYDKENPTRIWVRDFGEFEDLAINICRVIDADWTA